MMVIKVKIWRPIRHVLLQSLYLQYPYVCSQHVSVRSSQEPLARDKTCTDKTKKAANSDFQRDHALVPRHLHRSNKKN